MKQETKSSSKKINDLSNSPLRKRFFENEFVPENNLTVCALRVSSKKQERGSSLLEQEEITENYTENEKLNIQRTWQVAESASKHDLRHHFQEMIQFIKDSQSTDHPIKHIVFSHQSRSNRNRESARELEILVDMGVTLHFARDKRKLTCKSDLTELLMWLIENVKNQQFIDELTKNSMAGTLKVIERGSYPGSKLPFGYLANGRKDTRRFVLDGEKAKYMAAAFEIVDSPIFCEEELTDRKLKEKLDKMFPSLSGKTPTYKRFNELLRNPFYTGEEFIYAKTVFKADPALQPAIVDRGRWLRVQDVLSGRRRVRRISKTLPYTGMMTCDGFILDKDRNLTDEKCGCAITGEQILKKYKNGTTQLFDYYRCSNQTRACSQRDKEFMKKVSGRKVSYNDHEVEKIFQDIFKSFSFDEVTCKRMTQYLWDEHFEAQKTHSERQTKLEKRMHELDRMINEAYNDKVNKRITEKLWAEKDGQWQQEKEGIIAEYSSMQDKKDEYMKRGVQLIELMQHSEIIFKNATAEKKRKLVELVSSNLLLKDGTLQYHWKKPFDLFGIKGNLEEWRSLRDSNSCPHRERVLS